MTDSEYSLTDTPPGQLAQLMELGQSPRRVYNSDELAALLRHQLSVPMRFDLCALDRGLARQVTMLASSEGLLLRSFRGLFLHPNPPIELLELTKQFAKANREHPYSPIPKEIAEMLYLSSIAAALTKCRRRITRLDDSSLRRGLRWALEQPWLEDAIRDLFTDGLRHVPSENGANQ